MRQILFNHSPFNYVYRSAVSYWRIQTLLHLRKAYQNLTFHIISNNCWGSQIYPFLGKPYLTPFVGLFFSPDDYIKLLENLDEILSIDPVFGEPGQLDDRHYPVGILAGEITVHYLHYVDESDALEKWKRRLSRLSLKPEGLVIKFDDHDGGTQSLFQRFHQLPFPKKISFSKEKMNFSNNYRIRDEHLDLDGYQFFRVVEQYFDFFYFVTKGQCRKDPLNSFLHRKWLIDLYGERLE